MPQRMMMLDDCAIFWWWKRKWIEMKAKRKRRKQYQYSTEWRKEWEGLLLAIPPPRISERPFKDMRAEKLPSLSLFSEGLIFQRERRKACWSAKVRWLALSDEAKKQKPSVFSVWSKPFFSGGRKNNVTFFSFGFGHIFSLWLQESNKANWWNERRREREERGERTSEKMKK